MPENQELSPGKKSAQTKGRKGLRKAARRAADTKAIRKAAAQAQKRLAAAMAALEVVQQEVAKIDRSTKPGKRR